MADVFISYSKSHAHLTRDLAKSLEGKGLSVWWDTEMVPGESFRQRIQQELKSAKAVIVIWTAESIHSDYVLSEAERARIAGKLIQVRTADIDPHDLPPPFDTSHVALIEDRNAIFAGLSRFGMLEGFKPDPSQPLPVYGASRSRATGRGSMAVLGIAALAGAAIVMAAYRSSQPAPPRSVSGEESAAAIATRLIGQLSSGVTDSSLFAPDVRLGRLGLMSRTDALAELRKTHAAYARVNCRADGAPSIVGRAEKAPNGFRAKVVSVCDLTDKAGATTTQRVPLEVETVPDTQGNLLVSGLWQPEANVFWKPKARE
jgi:hypothetical protein